MAKQPQSDFYKPGALMHREISNLSSDYVDTTASGNWLDIDNGGGDKLQIVYTPLVDAWCVINLHLRAKHSVANKEMLFGVYDGAALTQIFHLWSPINGGNVSGFASIAKELTADIAYPLTAKQKYSDVGTLTVESTAGYTHLEILVFRKP